MLRHQGLRRFLRTLDPNVNNDHVDDVILRSDRFFEFKSLDPHRNVVRKGKKDVKMSTNIRLRIYIEILTGDSVDGVCVVVEGHLKVMDESSEVMRIFRRDFFFDVETLYSMPSLYDVEPSQG